MANTLVAGALALVLKTVQFRRSFTPGYRPTALAEGEPFIQYADQRVLYGGLNGSGIVEVPFAGGGSGPASTDALPEGSTNQYFTSSRARNALSAAPGGPIAYSSATGVISFTGTLFSGAYSDLTGKPTLFSGSYADLSGKPTLFSGVYADLSGKPAFAAIATSGSASDLGTGTVPAARLPLPTSTALGGVKANAGSAGQFVNGIDPATGLLSYGTPAGGGTGGGSVNPTGSFALNDVILAGSTDGNTIKSGGPASTLVRGLVSGTSGIAYAAATGVFTLAAPTTSVLGGVLSSARGANQFATGIDTTGALTYAQPAFSNLSGAASAAQLPLPTTTAIGGVQANAGAANQFVTGVSATTGALVYAQPSFGNLSGAATASQLPAFTGGDVTAAAGSTALTLVNTAVTAGSYGSANAVGTFQVDAKGRLVAAGSTAIAIPSSAVTDAASANTVSVIVKRDASGNFSANVITASLAGNATSATTSTTAGKLTTARAIGHSGDVTGSASFDGSADVTIPLTIGANKVLNSHLAQMAAGTLKGNATGATANAADSSLSAFLDLISSTQGAVLYRGASAWLALPPGTSGQYLTSGGASANPSWSTGTGGGNVSTSGTPANGQLALFTGASTIQGVTALPAANFPALSGDLTNTAGSTAVTIPNGTVTNTKRANMAANTLSGNNTGAAAAPVDLTVSQVKTLLAYALSELTGLLQAAQFPALTGAITNTAGSLATSLATGIVTYANLATAALATAASDIWSNVASKVATVQGLWSAFLPVAWGSISGTYTPSLSAFLNATATVSANLTLANPTNVKGGEAGEILFTMGAANLTIVYGSAWKSLGPTPTAPTTSGAQCVLSYRVFDASNIVFTLTKVGA